ncbi:MAG TPA: hypothetical protein VGE26_12160 [Sphingobacteriaceae bacterium]
MKKLLFLFLLPLLALRANGQEWTTVNIDSAVSIKLPKGYEKKDTTGQYSLVAHSPFGTILFFRTPDNPRVIPDIERDRHLEQFYSDYIDRVRAAAPNGSIINEKDTVLKNLKVKDFTLKTDTGRGVQYRNFRILHVNAASYTFEFLYPEIQAEYSKPEGEFFFNSIMVNEELERHDQYTTGEPAGIDPLWIITGVVILLIIVILAVWFSRKRPPGRTTGK